MSALTLTKPATPSGVSTQSGFALCAMALLSAVFLQKIALPGTDGILPLNLLLLPAIMGLALAFNLLEINIAAFAWYAMLILVGGLSAALSPSARVSALSLGLLFVVQLPLIFRLAPPSVPYERLLALLSTIGCICALLGVLQFVGQLFVGSDVAFFLDKSLPDVVMMKGYNSLIPLYWTSPVLKSNGMVFLEPSFFSQFLAVALVAELLVGARVLRLLAITAGLISSYSGTGLTMLALFLPFYFLRYGDLRLVFFAAIISFVFVVFGDAISIDAFTRRLSEFSDVQSSGWARFVSMFTVLQKVVLANDLTFFIGRGPGTVQEEFQQFSFYAFDPTWGKVIYEYGLLGSIAYFAFFYCALFKAARGLRFAMGYTYLFLGGYLLNPSVLMQLAALVVWFGETSPSDAEDGVTASQTPIRSSHSGAEQN
jgi:hypothetical protein